jgi:hypothetical protein
MIFCQIYGSSERKNNLLTDCLDSISFRKIVTVEYITHHEEASARTDPFAHRIQE